MKRQQISSESEFEKEIGYSRAIVQGNWVFISGTTGYDYQTMKISNDILEQTKQCLKNIKKTLHTAKANISDVVRVHYIFPNPNDFELCWPILRKYFGKTKPAATMISARLSNPKMKIEIEVTALKQHPINEEILETVKSFVKAGDCNNTTLLKNILHESYRNVQLGFFEEKGKYIINKTQYIKLIHEGIFGGSPRSFELKHMEVNDTFAYVSIQLRSSQLKFESLVVLIKENKAWKIIGNYPGIAKLKKMS